MRIIKKGARILRLGASSCGGKGSRVQVINCLMVVNIFKLSFPRRGCVAIIAKRRMKGSHVYARILQE
jgi:hypothetical protein